MARKRPILQFGFENRSQRAGISWELPLGMPLRPEQQFPFNYGPARDLANAKPDPAVSASSASSFHPPTACAVIPIPTRNCSATIDNS
jgi:hypothetical protein